MQQLARSQPSTVCRRGALTAAGVALIASILACGGVAGQPGDGAAPESTAAPTAPAASAVGKPAAADATDAQTPEPSPALSPAEALAGCGPFRQDGTFESFSKLSRMAYVVYRGTWTLDGSRLTVRGDETTTRPSTPLDTGVTEGEEFTNPFRWEIDVRRAWRRDSTTFLGTLQDGRWAVQSCTPEEGWFDAGIDPWIEVLDGGGGAEGVQRALLQLQQGETRHLDARAQGRANTPREGVVELLVAPGAEGRAGQVVAALSQAFPAVVQRAWPEARVPLTVVVGTASSLE